MSMRYESKRPRSIAAGLFIEPRTRLLLWIVPIDLRASVAGDLLEQLEQKIIAERGAEGARRWIQGEILRSTPAMLRHRILGGSRAALAARWMVALLLIAVHAIEWARLDRATAAAVNVELLLGAIALPLGALLFGATGNTLRVAAVLGMALTLAVGLPGDNYPVIVLMICGVYAGSLADASKRTHPSRRSTG